MRLSVMVSLILSSSLACTPVLAKDNCSQIAGHWSGSFTFKKNKDCLQYGKCTHDFAADVTFVDGVNYQVKLTSAVQNSYFVVQCKNNKITSSFLDSNARVFAQDADVYLDYEDADVMANMKRNNNGK